MSIHSTKERPTKESTTRERTTKERPAALRAGRLGVPWLTVLPLAVVLAYADGFWLTSLRGAVGAIERTQGPFAIWLRESTLVLPLFIFAVLGALTLALRWFGPVLTKPKPVVATGLLVVAAGTLAAIAEMAASSAYDFHLQSSQLQLMESMHRTAPGSTLVQQQQATLGLQLHAVAYGAVILLVTNLVLVGWAVAMRGGRLNLGTTRGVASAPHRSTARPAATTPAADSTHHSEVDGTAHGSNDDSTHGSRVEDLRLLLAAGLLGCAALHAALVPARLTGWADLLDPTSASLFFIALAAAELVVATVLLARPQQAVFRAAAAISFGPLVLYVYSRIAGIQFGPGAGIHEPVGLTNWAACALEVSTLIVAVLLLRRTGWVQRWIQRRPPATAHVRWLTLVAVIAVTAIGLAGSGLPVLDDFGGIGNQMVMTSHQ
jgi:hypothetical protein